MSFKYRDPVRVFGRYKGTVLEFREGQIRVEFKRKSKMIANDSDVAGMWFTEDGKCHPWASHADVIPWRRGLIRRIWEAIWEQE